MHVCSYDWAQPELGPDAALPRRARVVLDATLAAGDQPAVLFPSAGGNIHEFTALTDCAVLDLMSPPYSTGVCAAALARLVVQCRRWPWGAAAGSHLYRPPQPGTASGSAAAEGLLAGRSLPLPAGR